MEKLIVDPEEVRRALLGIKQRPSEWVGLLVLTGNGGDMRELDYPGYQRQRYTAGQYYRFQFPANLPEPQKAHAMGLYNNPTGDEVPFLINLLGFASEFVFLPHEAIQVDVSTVRPGL